MLLAELNRTFGRRAEASRRTSRSWRVGSSSISEQKAKDYVTLNEEKFFAERAEFDAEKEDEAKIKEQVETERPVFRRNYYNDEVLNIAVDYVNLLNGPQVAGVSSERPYRPPPRPKEIMPLSGSFLSRR